MFYAAKCGENVNKVSLALCSFATMIYVPIIMRQCFVSEKTYTLLYLMQASVDLLNITLEKVINSSLMFQTFDAFL